MINHAVSNVVHIQWSSGSGQGKVRTCIEATKAALQNGKHGAQQHGSALANQIHVKKIALECHLNRRMALITRSMMQLPVWLQKTRLQKNARNQTNLGGIGHSARHKYTAILRDGHDAKITVIRVLNIKMENNYIHDDGHGICSFKSVVTTHSEPVEQHTNTTIQLQLTRMGQHMKAGLRSISLPTILKKAGSTLKFSTHGAKRHNRTSRAVMSVG